jgi:hypothetical protein
MLTVFDSRRVYDVWQKLISDEELYELLLVDRHRELKERRGLSEEELIVLDEFRKESGLRWNIENLRFRAADHVMSTLRVYMPRTIYLLTRGQEDWLRDIIYEYVALHRWQELGRNYLAECLRFGRHVRERIARRRALPDIVEHVLSMELSVVELLREAGQVPAEQWPRERRELDDEALAAARPRPGPAVKIIDVPVDISDWIHSADPSSGTVKEGSLTLLLLVPSPEETFRIQRMSEGARLVFERFTGEKTAAEIARAVEDELGLEPAQVYRLLRRWLSEGALVA